MLASRLREWIVDRTSAEPVSNGAVENPPAPFNWWSTLGPIIIALILLEAVTGTFLAMYYSPHPDAAYESLRYVDSQLPLGRFLRGVHYYAASGIILALGVHLLATFFRGGYRPPRELVWLSGIAALGITIGFTFTGQLLPWDQNAYWATLVRTKYPGSVPVVGPMMQQLLTGGPEIGAMTLTRFYALHMLLLPALLLPLLGAHVWLASRKGITRTGPLTGKRTTMVLERQRRIFRTLAAVLAAIVAVYVLAIVEPARLEFKADPADATYHPRAEWYFLFLFQLLRDYVNVPVLKHVPGWMLALGLPAVGMGFLALAPWLDRDGRSRGRPVMVGAVVVGLLGMGGLTMRAFSQRVPNATPTESLFGHFSQNKSHTLDPQMVARGKAAFASAKPIPCSACHAAYGDYNAATAPDLSGYGVKTFLTEMDGKSLGHMEFYHRFTGYVRGTLRPAQTMMPKYPAEQLSHDDLDAIGAYLSQDPARVEVLQRKNPRAP